MDTAKSSLATALARLGYSAPPLYEHEGRDAAGEHCVVIRHEALTIEPRGSAQRAKEAEQTAALAALAHLEAHGPAVRPAATVSWPLRWPRPRASDEEAVRREMRIGRGAPDPGEGLVLSPQRQAAVDAAAVAAGMLASQASSLRDTVLLSLCQWRFRGTERDQKRMADDFEAAVAAHLIAAGVEFFDEHAQKRLAQPGEGTPDFVLPHGAVINGQHLCWLEAKNFYGAAADDLQRWSPIYKVAPQASRYVRERGPGAVVFRYGFSGDLVAPPGVVYLDASPFMPP